MNESTSEFYKGQKIQMLTNCNMSGRYKAGYKPVDEWLDCDIDCFWGDVRGYGPIIRCEANKKGVCKCFGMYMDDFEDAVKKGGSWKISEAQELADAVERIRNNTGSEADFKKFENDYEKYMKGPIFRLGGNGAVAMFEARKIRRDK